MILIRQSRPVLAFLTRHRVTVVIALTAVLASSGTAAAVSYLVLGAVNSAGATTTLKSGVNGNVLQITNTNSTGGTSARGLGITVPAGRAPLTVNSSAGKATNLNADKLDGIDSTGFARGAGVTVLANRMVLANGDSGIVLLTLPGLGQLEGSCTLGVSDTRIIWRNTSSSTIDMWYDLYLTDPSAPDTFQVVVHHGDPTYFYLITVWNGNSQAGTRLILGKGSNPGARSTATIDLVVYRAAAGAPCDQQATATMWSTP